MPVDLNLVTPPNFLPAYSAFSNPRYPFHCAYCPSVICPMHHVAHPGPVKRLWGTYVLFCDPLCSLSVPHLTSIIFCSIECCVVLNLASFIATLQVSAPYARMHWLCTFHFRASGKFPVTIWECLLCALQSILIQWIYFAQEASLVHKWHMYTLVQVHVGPSPQYMT